MIQIRDQFDKGCTLNTLQLILIFTENKVSLKMWDV